MNTSSMEQLIVEQLIAGPEQEGLRPVLPEGLKVLNLSVNDSVCYINFDATFLEGVTDVSEYLPIYAIVNSLTELTTVTRVRILVNGSQDVMFRDVVSLIQLLSVTSSIWRKNSLNFCERRIFD